MQNCMPIWEACPNFSCERNRILYNHFIKSNWNIGWVSIGWESNNFNQWCIYQVCNEFLEYLIINLIIGMLKVSCPDTSLLQLLSFEGHYQEQEYQEAIMYVTLRKRSQIYGSEQMMTVIQFSWAPLMYLRRLMLFYLKECRFALWFVFIICI